MTEARVGFLCNIASNINDLEKPNYNILRSHYLLKCYEVTGGYGLPAKKFSSSVRCPRCFLEWSRETSVELKPSSLSKRQHKRLKGRKSKVSGNKLESIKKLLHGNILEQICTFCNHTTRINIEKPDTKYLKNKSEVKQENVQVIDTRDDNKIKTKKVKASQQGKINQNKDQTSKLQRKLNNTANVYTNAFDVFSLSNEKNTLKDSVKEPAKIIKNSKRKKDKFAGLCEKAVLATAKMKEEKLKKNKLNLFLKPSA